MKLPTFLSGLLACVLVAGYGHAAERLTGAEGRVYIFSDWDSAPDISATTAGGNVSLERQVRRVEIFRDPAATKPTESRVIQVVYDRTSNTRLIGYPDEHYAVVDGAVVGLRLDGIYLQLRRGVQAEASGFPIQDWNQFLNSLSDNPLNPESPESATVAFNLRLMCPYGIVAPLLDSRPISQFARIVDVTVGQEGMKVAMETFVGNALTLSLSSKFEIKRLNINESPYLLVRDCTKVGPVKWSGPTWKSVPDSDGERAGQSCSTSLNGIGAKKDRVTLRAVALDSGEVWIGPSECKLAYFDGRVFGFRLIDDRILQGFAGSGEPIPLESPQSYQAFEKMLADYESKTRARGAVAPDFETDIRSLFAREVSFGEDPEIVLKRVSATDELIWVQSRFSQGITWLSVAFDAQLQVVSKQADPESRFQRPRR